MHRNWIVTSLLASLSASAFGQSTVPLQSYLRNNSFVNWESPHVHPLDITPDGTKLLAVNTANNSLEIYNPGSPVTFVKSIPVGLDPVSVRARTNSEAWVVNVISDSVSVVDLTDGIVTATVQTNDEPADVIFAGASQNLALVSCAQAKTVMVLSATAPSAGATAVIPINGEQPRALAVDPTGRYVYLAIFESGNATTAVVGGVNNGYENDLVRNPSGPYGGLAVPPNNGNSFNPPLNPALPPAPPVSLIVKRTLVGGVVQWLDDNLKNWANFISGSPSLPSTPGNRVAGWDMPDRDVAIIDTSNNSVTYQSGLMNILMAIAVNPVTKTVSVVGTDATNQIRYEPVLQGAFTRVNMATFAPGGSNIIQDLNPHIISYANAVTAKTTPIVNFAAGTSSQNSIGDPRAIVWNTAGTQAYITGMGSNNVIIVNSNGTRAGQINVGQGPTGLVLSGGFAYVLNKFDASITTISTSSNQVTGTAPLYFDPTPAAIKTGRPMLYNTHLTSSLGQLSCASCHVDARWDRLDWDLGNPAGTMLTNPGSTNTGNPDTYHPMKGPFLTMTMVDDMQSPFLHWRGDRPVLEDFEGAFNTLMGSTVATESEIVALRSFLATISLPPNPNRNLDNSYSATVPIIGPNNTTTGTGNATNGAAEFENNCRSCHPGHTNRGFLFVDTNLPFGYGIRNPPTWKNFYKRQGIWFQNATATNVGFGFQQDGTFDATQNNSRDNDMMAFMMSFNGGYPYEPTGLNGTNWSNNTHAAVGKQVTLSPAVPTDPIGLLPQLEALGDSGAIGLVAKGGVVSGTARRGWMYLGNGVWQSDHLAEVDSTASLNSLIAGGATITFTAVPNESAARIGIDMDGDGILDYDDAQPNVPNLTPVNLALTGSATSASVYDGNHTAAQAIDGNTIGYFDQNSMLHTAGGTNDWFQEDLGANSQINLIQLFNRWDCCAYRLANVSVFISQVPFVSTDVNQTRAQVGVKEFYLSGVQGALAQIPMQTAGRYIRVQLNNTTNPLQLAEVRAFGYNIASFTIPAAQTNGVGSSVNLPLSLQNPTTGATYTYTATNLPAGLTINAATGVITGTISPSAASSYTTTVTAAGSIGAGNPSVSFNWTITGSAPSFTLSVPAISLQAGTGNTFPITITPTNGFTGNVNFSLPGLPTGVSLAFLPNSATSTTLVLYAQPGTLGGTYPLILTGTSGNTTATTPISLVITGTTPVPGFTVSASTTSITLTQGTGGAWPVTVTPTNGFTGAVTLSLSGLPAAGGASDTFLTNSATSYTLVIYVPAGVPAGTYPLTITGTSGSVTASTSLSLVVPGNTPGFTITPGNTSLTLAPGNGGTLPVNITPTNGFNGNVALSLSGLPGGGASDTFVTNSATNSTLVIYLPAAVPPGTYKLTITGSSGATTGSAGLSLVVP